MADDPRAKLADRDDRVLLKRLCSEGICAGPGTIIQVYRNRADQIAVYVVQGNLQRCSHPPWQYFNAEGTLLLTQGEHPVASQAEAQRYAAERAAVLAGLTKAEVVMCPEIG